MEYFAFSNGAGLLLRWRKRSFFQAGAARVFSTAPAPRFL
jgi:hypothetical protein